MPRKKASVRTTSYTALDPDRIFMRSVLSVVLRFHRLCKPANPAFTISKNQGSGIGNQTMHELIQGVSISVEWVLLLTAVQWLASRSGRRVTSPPTPRLRRA